MTTYLEFKDRKVKLKADRIRDRIRALESLRDCFEYRSGSFYPMCKFCGRTNVEVSIQQGHRKGCQVNGVDKQIAYWRDTLRRLVSPGLSQLGDD